jgi:nicotinate-nucleotide adenylyltransferase
LFQRREGTSQKLLIDEVRVVPCGLRSDKAYRTLPTKRLEMLHLALGDYFPSDYPVKVDPIEVENGASIPTYFLLQDLQKKEPDTEFWFIMGDDLMEDIDQWEGGQMLLKETKFIIYDRNGTAAGHKNWPSIYKRASTDFQTVSSTEVRNRVRLRQGIVELVTGSVESYIAKEGLYL